MQWYYTEDKSKASIFLHKFESTNEEEAQSAAIRRMIGTNLTVITICL